VTDIYTKIERYSDIGVGIDLVSQEKAALIDEVLTPEIKEKLAEIDAEFEPKIEQLLQEKSQLEAEIKDEVLNAGRTIKGTYHSFVWSKPRVSWDTKALDGYALAHPEIAQFRKPGEPSVSVRRA
jgi:malate synthase